MNIAQELLKKLNYLPRWAWYAASFFLAGPFGPIAVYLLFHALKKAAQDAEESQAYGQRPRRGHVFGHGYQDAECTVTSDEEINAQWAQTEASARRAERRSAYDYDDVYASTQDDKPAEETFSSSSDCETVIREGREAMRRIRHANDLIADPALSAQIDSIETSCGQILSMLEQRPGILSELRTFLRYYLPTTLKLLDARARLENTANTPKARQVRARISEAVGVIDKAFCRQVEALDEYRFIDLESEMDVLRDMLRADGLLDESDAGTPLSAH